MVSSPKHNPEFTPSAEGDFSIIRALAVGRIVDALQQQKNSPGITYVGLHRIEGIKSPLMMVQLTQNYPSFRMGLIGALELSVPGYKPDVDNALLADATEDNIVVLREITRESKDYTQSLVLNAETYTAAVEAQNPLVEDLDSKLFVYNLVPLQIEQQ